VGIEIERKFLVDADTWRLLESEGSFYCQGYLSTSPQRTVRVRVADEKGFLTVKGLVTGATRAEYEYEIPIDEAQALLKICQKPLIEKKRHIIDGGEVTWEVDEFLGENQGLILAEVELRNENQEFMKPSWLAGEVTHDRRYYNANLVAYPYGSWHEI
jgi:adenylate cyclase